MTKSLQKYFYLYDCEVTSPDFNNTEIESYHDAKFVVVPDDKIIRHGNRLRCHSPMTTKLASWENSVFSDAVELRYAKDAITASVHTSVDN